MRNLSMAMAVVLAGLLASYVQTQNQTGAGKPSAAQDSTRDDKSKDAKENPELAYADHPVRVLLDYLQPGQPIQRDALDCKAGIATGPQKVQVLFATVVDPDRTRLSLALDRQLDAILKAAQKSDYQFQDLWLPWRLTQDKNETKLQKDARERLPGLLTFRRENKLLAVWLVGETPTAGISQVQFQQAACFTRMTEGVEILGVLGPNFSGTLASLKRAMLDAGFRCFEKLLSSCPTIVSGTTTARSAIKEFQGTFGDFRSMIHDDRYAQEHLRDFLKPQRLSGARVVVLAEGNTRFGSEFNTTSEQPVFDDLISYPREISRLRNAYQSDPKLAAQQEAATTPEARRQLLLPLHDSAAGQDTVPNFSLQTPISLETVLFQIAERLRNGRFDVAVLTGSNVLDTLFLSRFLAENVPDMRVVVFDSDLLFVHGTDSLDHLGSLSVSRYPLYSQFESTRPLDLFGSMSERGLYESALRLIDDVDHLKIDPQTKANLPETNSGPLWLSVVGRGAYWPVAQLNLSIPDSKLEVGAPTRVWNVIFWITTLLTVYLTGLLLFALLLKQDSKTLLSTKLAIFHPNSDGSEPRRATAVFHLLSILLLTAVYWALLTGPARVRVAVPAPWDWMVQTAAGIVVLLALFFVAARSVFLWGRNRYIAYWVGAGAFILLASIGWPLAFSHDSNQSGLLRAIRSVNVPSGVAPNVPVVFFLLALVWWCWTNWLRTLFIAEREVILPKLEELPRSLYDRLIQLLRMPIVCDMPGGLVVSLLSVLCIVFGFRWLTSVENRAYDALIIVLLAANSAALLCTSFGFFAAWSMLRSYLKVLNTYSSQDMDAIAKSVQLPSFWTTGVEDHTFPIARKALDIFRDLRFAHSKYTWIASDVARFDAALRKAADHVRNGEHIPTSETLRIRIWPVRIGKKLRALRPHPSDVEANICKIISLFHVAFIRYVLTQMRNLLSYITVGFLLTACAIHSYPFQGGSYLRWWTGILFLVPAVAVTLVWLQMEYDPILAKLNSQKEGLDLKSWERLASAGALPLIAGVSALFPAVGQFLFSWVHPTLSGMN